MTIQPTTHVRSRGRHLGRLRDIAGYLALLALAAWLLAASAERLGYHWQWYRVPRYLLSLDGGELAPGPLLDGLGWTLRLTGVSLILSAAIGLLTALLRLSDSPVGRLIARGYLELIRNTPLLIQIFFIYFVISPIAGIDRFTSGVLALSLFEGAYASEIIRAGILSVNRGQWEAAWSLGLSPASTYTRIVLPQAVRRTLPPLTGQAVSLVKDSALVSTISIFELTMQGKLIVADTFLTFEIWFTVAALYLVVTTALSLLADRLEHALRIEA